MKSRFDEVAATWDNNPVRIALANAIGAAIRRAIAIQPHWRVLDYGAGTGLLTLQFQPEVASVVAMDSSAGMLETLRQKLAAGGIGNVETLQWDLQTRACAGSDFDLVVSSMTFHHVREVPLVIERLVGLLKVGGWLAIADLDPEDGSFHAETPDVFHKGFARTQVREWLEKAGLAGVSITDSYDLSKPDATGQLRSYQVFLAVGQLMRQGG